MTVDDNELPGMWESADFTGGDPDERSYAERERQRADSDREEWIGQLEGGPDEGNLISATVRRFRHEVTYRSWLDGRDGEVAEFTVKGHYVWNEPTGTFRWELERSL